MTHFLFLSSAYIQNPRQNMQGDKAEAKSCLLPPREPMEQMSKGRPLFISEPLEKRKEKIESNSGSIHQQT